MARRLSRRWTSSDSLDGPERYGTESRRKVLISPWVDLTQGATTIVSKAQAYIFRLMDKYQREKGPRKLGHMFLFVCSATESFFWSLRIVRFLTSFQSRWFFELSVSICCCARRHSQAISFDSREIARSKMREVISVHVGQAGVQIGNACCKYSLCNVATLYSPGRKSVEKTRHFAV